MLSPHDFFFFGVIGDVVEGGREGLANFSARGRLPGWLEQIMWGVALAHYYRIIPYHMGPPPSDYHDKWGETHAVHCLALKDCHRREVNLRIRPNLCSRGIHGVCGYIRVDTKTQQKEWHPSTSVICQTRPLKLTFGFSVNDGDGKQVAYQMETVFLQLLRCLLLAIHCFHSHKFELMLLVDSFLLYHLIFAWRVYSNSLY